MIEDLPDEIFAKCKNCKGKGVVGKSSKCLYCKGKGIRSVAERRRRC